jgi:hypothetical protein
MELIMRSLTLNYYQDPGHGWVRVSIGLLHGLKIAHEITPYSYRREDYAYLEEDCDLSRLLAAAEAAGITVKLRHFHTNKQSKIRGYRPYYTPTTQAAVEEALKAKIRAQGCSAEFMDKHLIIKAFTL